jgi:acyl-CoA thioester hydrolase
MPAHEQASQTAAAAPRHVHEARIRVRYAETDQMGVVYYSNYLIWMEVGRVEYCKSVGFDYRDMEAQDKVVLAVAEAHCRYLYPARFDDEVIVRTWIEDASPRLVRFGYQMLRAEDGRLLARGETKHVFCGPNLRPARLPEKYHRLFGIKP